MTAPTFHYSRIVDLSRSLVQSEGQHPWVRFETRIDSIVSDPETAPASGRWYVVTQIGMSGHAGTHVEAPLHAVEKRCRSRRSAGRAILWRGGYLGPQRRTLVNAC